MGVYSLDCGSQSSVKIRYGSFSGRDYRLLGLWRPATLRYTHRYDRRKSQRGGGLTLGLGRYGRV